MKRLRGAAQRKTDGKKPFINFISQQSPLLLFFEGLSLLVCAVIGMLMSFPASSALIYAALCVIVVALALLLYSRRNKNVERNAVVENASIVGYFIVLSALMLAAFSSETGFSYYIACYLFAMLLGAMAVPPKPKFALAATFVIQATASLIGGYLGAASALQLIGMWCAAGLTQFATHAVYRYRLSIFAMAKSAKERSKQLKTALFTIRNASKALAEKENELERRTKRMQMANKQLEELAVIDALTGLYNRRGLDVWLAEAWRMCASENKPISIAMIDIDKFKPYNDHFGHVKGDECLRQVAASLKTSVQRGSDIVARYGGEEFLLLLPRTDYEGAMRVAEAARVDVQNLCLPREKDSLYPVVTVSIGVATIVPGNGDGTVTRLIMAADDAMYRAKQSGRNRVLGFDGIPGAAIDERSRKELT